VRPDLMPGGDDLGDQPGVALRDPADNEKRGAHTGGVEAIQQPPRGQLDARFEALPARPIERRHAAHVKPLLDIDRERVTHASDRWLGAAGADERAEALDIAERLHAGVLVFDGDAE